MCFASLLAFFKSGKGNMISAICETAKRSVLVEKTDNLVKGCRCAPNPTGNDVSCYS